MHCNVLPRYDASSQVKRDSVQIAKKAYLDGVHTIVATPLENSGVMENDMHVLRQSANAFEQLLEKQHIAIKVIAGQTVRLSDALIEELQSSNVPTIAGTNYVMVKMPHAHIPYDTSDKLYELQIAGYYPIIVQAERNKQLRDHPDTLYKLVKYGSYVQIQSGSICGEFGKEVQKFAHQMIEHNLAHFIGSGNQQGNNKYNLKRALDIIEKQHGVEKKHTLIENAALLEAGQTAMRDMPERIQHKSWFQSLFGTKK
ncbi:tyrosine-protein phosphatase [Pontibacillus litoralis]|nr:CpsB/CapC family capsule biosynthesis tyrosine phosphatase [Pontibacillus litoralis]